MPKGPKRFKVPHSEPLIGLPELMAVRSTFRSGEVSGGSKLPLLEAQFREITGKQHAIAFSSWTSAAHAFLLRMRLSTERNTVLLPSFTFAASVNVVIQSGFRPRFVDISPEDFALDPIEVKRNITEDVAGIMLVHYAGVACQSSSEIRDLARRRDIFFLEDCAEALGSFDPNGQMAGSFGTSIFSFFATKNITSGEGGMICLDDDMDAAWLRRFQSHGVEKDTHMNWLREAKIVGLNLRLSNLQAAIAVEQMRRLPNLTENRRKCAQRYFECLPREVLPLGYEVLNRSSWQMFPIIVPDVRDDLVRYLRGRGIEASAHFDPPCHDHIAYGDFKPEHSLKVTEKVAKSVVTLPMSAKMKPRQAQWVAEEVRSFLDT